MAKSVRRTGAVTQKITHYFVECPTCGWDCGMDDPMYLWETAREVQRQHNQSKGHKEMVAQHASSSPDSPPQTESPK